MLQCGLGNFQCVRENIFILFVIGNISYAIPVTLVGITDLKMNGGTYLAGVMVIIL